MSKYCYRNSVQRRNHKILKKIIWDYDVDSRKLYDVLEGKRSCAGSFDFEKLFIRMLERLPWYDLVAVAGVDFIKNNLNSSIIKKIRFKELREKYEYVRKVLQGESLSPSGWGPEYYKSIKHTLLSNRWYRT